MQLSELYDADKRVRDMEVRKVASNFRIPHPLSRVKYADGTAPYNAGREVRSPWINPKES